jgi:hypothetical protein
MNDPFINIAPFVNAALVLIALYIGARIVVLLTMIATSLREITASLHQKEDDHA